MPGAPISIDVPLDDGQALRAELTLPDGDGPFPGVVVLHESFGLNDDIRRIAHRFAEAGYAALAPSLFSHGPRAQCLMRLMSAAVRKDPSDPVADVLSARAALAARPEVDAGRIAVAGFCLGGGFALVAGLDPGVRAAAVHYGDVPPDTAALQGVCPIIGTFGARDKLFGSAMAERLEDHLTELGVAHDIKVYPGAGHSILNRHEGWQGALARVPSPMRVGYRDADAEDGWRRMLAFFDEHVAAAS